MCRRPRVDYTPEDDDFLCRYLAAHHPNGSWQSRKTYNTLASDFPDHILLANTFDCSGRYRRDQ
jgi:hypothetical protein